MGLKAVLYIGLLGLGVGCSNSDPRLQGERELLDGTVFVETDARFLAEDLPDLRLPSPQPVPAWTHQGGNAQHIAAHAELPSELTLSWSRRIGAGDGKRHQISAAPVAQGGQVYTLDSQSMVTAIDETGTILWQSELGKSSDALKDASGGGLAVGGTQLFVTTGFGTVVALDTASGAELWTQDLASYGGASPTVYDDLLYIAARDGAAWAIDTSNGRIKWQVAGPTVAASHTGGPGPAVSDKYAVFPFGTGDVLASFRKGGLRSWSSGLSGARLGLASTQVRDLTGQPVIEGSSVYLASSAGRMAAVDLNTGLRIWTAKQGSQGHILVAGGAVFAVSDAGNLIRLSKDDGALIWSTPLPKFTKKSVKSRAKIHAHYGPILAGGRLILASSDGLIRQFNPADGTLITTVDLPSGAASAPIVVNGTLYVLSTKGDLLAFR
ncbi:MAG: PQQ-binding-like beta-propeller repeat protein [Planktomarina temperata]|jgi:outer membrane protein assembly factor BamB|uniref:PQQ-like beta-propeller repeat protein n=1 Tax=Planktomarina TaxID=1284657 RepID=UPI00014760DB|nr:PQQ-binding-like beta-propeller repeat protein [Planktomarina temperata]MDP4062779.1 Outer membrane protein assembly factor BamB [Rhodobacteraceae bacterium LE17]MDA7484530.1 PQQ-like beta-propeller repeat protein [Planktomarina temperata]MDA8784668.1 PQQ-like beta-propeller repeat protein [Planktomarina temperata]MDB0017706.1 PQQ-like beta-propeller repeat protein [Planktomarina temperata]